MTARGSGAMLLGCVTVALALLATAIGMHHQASPVAVLATTPASVQLVTGAAQSLIPRLSGESGASTTAQPVHVRWHSTNEHTAVVDGDGTVRALAVGATTIVAEADGARTAQVTVRVLRPPSDPAVRAVPTPAPATRRAVRGTDITTAVVQLQKYLDGRLDAMARGGYQLAVIDPARDAGSSYFTTDEIRGLQRSGTRVLAYFEIGSIENFRPDYPTIQHQHHPELLLNEWKSWPGERFVRYWDPRWWDLAIRPRLDRALAAGFDGVFLDTPLAYEELDLRRVPGMSRQRLAADMVGLIRRISAHGKASRPGFWVFPNNSPELAEYPGYLRAIDGIGMESLFFAPTDRRCTQAYCTTNLKAARSLRRAGKVVLAIDYANRAKNITEACRRYRREHFVGYLAVRNLDGLRPPCP
ncbi:MAG TPA: endo alpha-1,4 polygalactosaminidase [Kineosporiaceae bacterium]|nr:endo alpha-1,4 polygalactosaminidase [Kineosporiaceae bacterium]